MTCSPGASRLPNTIRIKPPDSPTDVVTTLAQVARWWSGAPGLGVTIANAALVAQMSQAINKSLLHMEMRSMDNQAATFHVGDRYPILTASYIGQTGAPGIGSQLPVNNPSNSNGTGSATQTGKVFGGVSQPAGMITADLNGDGVPDIVTAAAGANAVAVLFGNGDGTFQDAVTYPAGSTPSGVAVADLNSDGVPDLIAANAGSNDVSVLLGNSDGTFQPALAISRRLETGRHRSRRFRWRWLPRYRGRQLGFQQRDRPPRERRWRIQDSRHHRRGGQPTISRRRRFQQRRRPRSRDSQLHV